MGISLENAVLAVDGGGSGLRLALATDDGTTVVDGGPCNVSTDHETAIRALMDGFAALAKTADTDTKTLYPLPCYLGLAGVVSDAIAETVRVALPLTHVHVEEDRRAAITGALGHSDGALAHCGTGSFLGVQRAGAAKFAGGWGARLGDEASAHWIATRAMAATLAAEDGTGPASDLTQSLSEHLGGSAGIIAFARDADPAEIADLAPRVTAQAGDPTTRQILTVGAIYLERVLTHLGWRPGEPLCLTGGAGASYADYLSEPARAGVIPPKGKPIDGAIALARAHAAGSAL